MTALRLARSEMRRLTAGTLPKLALTAMTLVPLLYGAMYLYANWNPYGNLDDLPAAIVVDDHGTTGPDGKPVHAGEDVAGKLAESGAFDWQRTSASEAASGVANGRYSFALTVPTNFSAALASPGHFQPEQAKLRVTTNDANNYLVGQIADKVVSQVRKQVAAESGEKAADQLLLGLSTVHDKTVQAAEGAGRLAGGPDTLDNGAHQAADGSRQLRGGLDQLHTQTRDLPDQSRQLANGAHHVADGNRQLADTADQLGNASARLAGNLDDTRDRIAEQLRASGLPQNRVQHTLDLLDQLNKPITDTNRAVQDRVGAIDHLADGAQRVAEGNEQLADQTPQLTRGISQLDNGAHTLAPGAAQVADGNEQLAAQTPQLTHGIGQLSDGAHTLDEGTHRLADGSGQLASGSHELADQLKQGAGDIPHPNDRTRADTARTIGDPVAVDTVDQAKARTYGAGLAPFFLGLALWIGGYVLFLLMRPLSAQALAAEVSPWRVALGGWLPAALVGAVQAGLLFAAVVFGVGVEPAHPWATLEFLLLTSFAFTAVMHSLNAAFGARGKFLGLVLLVLQLVTAGGTFPWQTIPDALHPLHQVLPMSYVVEALRPLLYGGQLAAPVQSGAGVLLSYLLGGLLLSTVAAWKFKTWSPARLKPELTL